MSVPVDVVHTEDPAEFLPEESTEPTVEFYPLDCRHLLSLGDCDLWPTNELLDELEILPVSDKPVLVGVGLGKQEGCLLGVWVDSQELIGIVK